MNFLHLIIIFSIFGVLSTLGHDISNAFHQAYSDINHYGHDIINTGIGIGNHISHAVVNTFFGQFANDVVTPVFSYFDSFIIQITKDIISGVAYVMALLLGIPEGFIQYFSQSLGSLGIVGFPVTMLIIGIGIVLIVAIGLFIVKLAQYLIEVL